MSQAPFLCDRNYQYVSATGSSSGKSPEVRGPVVAVVGGSGGFGIALPSSSNMLAGYTIFIYNNSGATITIYVKGADTINGVGFVSLDTDRGAVVSTLGGKNIWWGASGAGVGFP